MAFATPLPMSKDRRDSTSQNNNSSFTSWSNASFTDHHETADEATIDEYARRVLEEASPPDVNVDADYLGPYLTGVLRAEQASAIEELPDYDNLLELLQEHCTMARQEAQWTLQKIAQAVWTQTIPTVLMSSAFASPPTSGGLSALKLLETFNVEEAVAQETATAPSLKVDTAEAEEETKPASNNNKDGTAAATSIVSPVQPDNLIPVDLLGAIDNDAEEENNNNKDLEVPIAPADPLEEEFPSLAVAAKVTKRASRSSRSRQGSIDESSLRSAHSDSSRKISPSLRPTPVGKQQPHFYPLEGTEDNNPATMLQMACDILMQMNPDMGQDAIFQAACQANANVPVAQYLMDCAMTAPPVCRHLLHAGCYRADCQFSHDLEGHTCVFWLRGHCNKGSAACPFLHGYNEQWLVQLMEQQQEYYNSNNNNYNHQEGWEQHRQTTTTTQPLATSTNSFANIASQGYNDQTCFQQQQCTTGHPYNHKEEITAAPTMKIPQDVWNPHERRADASAFHIVDPLQRYQEVARHNTNGRTDVIDLHFQSTKSFALVLESVLPDKLASSPAGGLWIVTGTGHGVGSKTHQKGGGILQSAVQNWLVSHGYEFYKGKDRNGHGGAVFVKKPRNTLQ